jgi:hypothetical protein
MMNIVLDCNDRLGRKVVLLATGAAYLLEVNEEAPSPYSVIHCMVAVDALNACLEKHVGPSDIRAL